jgi:cytidine deaminase
LSRRRLNPKTEKAMMEVARRALKNAYSPYSKYKVAAAVLDEDGFVSGGCNVENASYGGTVCAERVAIFKAVSEGAREMKAIVVMTEAKSPWAPCGLCRQVMLEFGNPNTPVILKSTKGATKRLTLADLCPHSFSPKQMK